MVGSGLIWAPPGRGRRVPGARNGPFWPQKNPGACFWGRKKPLREWGHAIPRFSIKTGLLGCRKTQGRVFGGGKNPCGKHADSHPGFGQGPVSNLILMGLSRPWLKEWPSTHHHNSKSHTLGFEPGASGVRRPCARPLGNLTTVGHLARVSPDLRSHFQKRKIKFSDV